MNNYDVKVFNCNMNCVEREQLKQQLTSETARADMLQEENRKLKSYLKMLGVNYEWK